MRYLFLVLIFLSPGFLFAAETPSQLLDGKKVIFAKWLVNGEYFYTDQEKDAKEASLVQFGTVAVNTAQLTPVAAEVLISTAVLKFENYSDFKASAVDAVLLMRKVKDLQAEAAVYTGVDDAKSAEYSSRANWLYDRIQVIK